MNLDLEASNKLRPRRTARRRAHGRLLYARLFAAAPSVKPLFAGIDLKKQKAMLVGTLVLLRKSLRDLDAIVPKLHQLGKRHVAETVTSP